jgi:DNA-binding MarR family transcriptional regulator
MGNDKAQMARTVKELEARALVTRQPHKSDWRAQCLRLTSEGEHIHARLSAQRAAFGKEVLDDLTANERDQLERALEKMRMRLFSSALVRSSFASIANR